MAHSPDHPYRRGPKKRPTPVQPEASAFESELHRKVAAVVADNLGIDETLCKPEATLAGDLGADSLDVVEICMCLEEELRIEIPEEELDTADERLTIRDILTGLSRLGVGA